jgi:hypothetical protein
MLVLPFCKYGKREKLPLVKLNEVLSGNTSLRGNLGIPRCERLGHGALKEAILGNAAGGLELKRLSEGLRANSFGLVS